MEKILVKNDLFNYEKRYIFQLENSFKFSLDSILLAEFVNVGKNDIIIDFCMGLAPLPLILTTKYQNNIIGFEIQKDIFDIAKKSIAFNNLDDQIRIYNDDIKNIGKYIKKNSVDIITCNPPYFKVNENSYINEDEISKNSRHECLITLEDVFVLSSMYLKDCGALYMVHRPERLDEIIILANKYNVKVKEIITVITNEKLNIKTILVKCVKNSKFNVKIKAINVCGARTYKNIFEESK